MGYSINPNNSLYTRRYIVVPNTSPRRAAAYHKPSSPESVTRMGCSTSSDRTWEISASTISRLTEEQSPKGKNGSFSTCQYKSAGEFLYRATTISIYSNNSFSNVTAFTHDGT